jgi:spore maturation protein CgeB
MIKPLSIFNSKDSVSRGRGAGGFTAVGINKDLVEDGANEFYAMTAAEWEEKLSILIENSQLRERMGREGRRRVLENYTYQACAPRLFSILTRAMEKPHGGERRSD